MGVSGLGADAQEAGSRSGPSRAEWTCISGGAAGSSQQAEYGMLCGSALGSDEVKIGYSQGSCIRHTGKGSSQPKPLIMNS